MIEDRNPFIPAYDLLQVKITYYSHGKGTKAGCCEICVHNDLSKLCEYNPDRCTSYGPTCKECHPCTRFEEVKM